MKRKDDDLLRLAFGELSAERARAIEAQANGDASARAELESFRELRSGLQNLPAPPPDNLSAERLRAAILDRDLRVRRPAPFQWTWIPFAAAALAAAFIVSRPTTKVEPQILAMKDKPVTAPLNAPRFDPVLDFHAKANQAAPEASATAVTKMAAKAPEPAVRRPAPHSRTRRQAQVEDATPLFALAASRESQPKASTPPPEPQTIAAPPSTIVADARDAGGPENVVIVSTKRDLDTGANAATETEASNVLVGG